MVCCDVVDNRHITRQQFAIYARALHSVRSRQTTPEIIRNCSPATDLGIYISNRSRANVSESASLRDPLVYLVMVLEAAECCSLNANAMRRTVHRTHFVVAVVVAQRDAAGVELDEDVCESAAFPFG